MLSLLLFFSMTEAFSGLGGGDFEEKGRAVSGAQGGGRNRNVNTTSAEGALQAELGVGEQVRAMVSPGSHPYSGPVSEGPSPHWEGRKIRAIGALLGSLWVLSSLAPSLAEPDVGCPEGSQRPRVREQVLCAHRPPNLHMQGYVLTGHQALF